MTDRSPKLLGHPLKHRENSVASESAAELLPKEKTPQLSAASGKPRGEELRSSTMQRFFQPLNPNNNLVDPSPDHQSSNEQKIISSIKTFRKKN
jgi:hypothetical protein